MVLIREAYEEYGVREFYETYGAAYHNPHEPTIVALLQQIVPLWSLPLDKVLDLACGSGEVTVTLQTLGNPTIEGIDPYTGPAYLARTGQHAQSYTFEQIATGALAGRYYNLIVCSFAMHLVAESWLPGLAFQLSLISDMMLILTPHKRPHIKAAWGWTLTNETVVERVRARLYRSNNTA